MNNILIGFEFEFGLPMDKQSLLKKLKRDMNFKFHSLSNTKKWHLTFDTSLIMPENIIGHELVSPVFYLNDGMVILKRVFDWMKQNNCCTNYLTGFHVNLSFEDKSINNKIDVLKLILFLDEEGILRKFNRLRNSFCQSHQTVLRYYGYNGDIKSEQDLRNKLIWDDKQMFVNLMKFKNKKYLEFRGMGNKNYHKKFKTIEKVINHFVKCMNLSIDNSYEDKFEELIEMISRGD